MSNLGTVYKIDLNTGCKNIYPVVYTNKNKLYCKIYGCDDLEIVYTNECSYSYRKKVVSLEEFKKLALENDKWSGWVYVPPHVHYWFPELKESAFDRRINDNKNRIEHIKRNIKNCESTIKTKEKEIQDSLTKIALIEADILKCERLRKEEQSKKYDET